MRMPSFLSSAERWRTYTPSLGGGQFSSEGTMALPLSRRRSFGERTVAVADKCCKDTRGRGIAGVARHGVDAVRRLVERVTVLVGGLGVFIHLHDDRTFDDTHNNRTRMTVWLRRLSRRVANFNLTQAKFLSV